MLSYLPNIVGNQLPIGIVNGTEVNHHIEFSGSLLLCAFHLINLYCCSIRPMRKPYHGAYGDACILKLFHCKGHAHRLHTNRSKPVSPCLCTEPPNIVGGSFRAQKRMVNALCQRFWRTDSHFSLHDKFKACMLYPLDVFLEHESLKQPCLKTRLY